MYRTRANNVAMRDGMFQSLEQAFAESNIPWDECYQESAGDSILALARSTVPKGAFVGTLPLALVAALTEHNESHPVEERIRLRMALHAGEITHDRYGVTAPAITHAARLLASQQLKEALANSPGSLAMIVSDWFYTDVVRHHEEFAPTTYRRASVVVKETNAVGWIRVPGHELPPLPPALVDTTVAAVETTTLETPVAIELPVLMSALRPSSPEFYDVVTALEDIQCMRHEHTRALVVDQLTFAGAIRYFPNRRAHLISILRTCCDFPDGPIELVSAISDHEESGSLPLKRLVTLLTGGAR